MKAFKTKGKCALHGTVYSPYIQHADTKSKEDCGGMPVTGTHNTNRDIPTAKVCPHTSTEVRFHEELCALDGAAADAIKATHRPQWCSNQLGSIPTIFLGQGIKYGKCKEMFESRLESILP